MRMWMINPKLLCRKHLLGEHSEIHKHKHIFEKKYSITGRIFPVVLIEPNNMEERHNRLVSEMISRGYKHNSPYTQPDISYLSNREKFAKVDKEYNLIDLMIRCDECQKRIVELGKHYE